MVKRLFIATLVAISPLLAIAQPVIDAIRHNNRTGKEVTDFYRWVDDYIRTTFLTEFGVSFENTL